MLLVTLPLAGERSAGNLEIVVRQRLGQSSAVGAGSTKGLVLGRIAPLKMSDFGRLCAVGRRAALLLTRLERKFAFIKRPLTSHWRALTVCEMLSGEN